MIVVSKKHGDYSTLQDAIFAVPDNGLETTILLRPGVYEEKVYIRKNNLKIIGTDKNNTIIRYNEGAKKTFADGTEIGTFNTSTVLFSGKNIQVENITFENYAGPGNIAGQALAVYVASDQTVFQNCSFIGFQDTIYTGPINFESFKNSLLPKYFLDSKVAIHHNKTRNLFVNCFITGDVDYIFGSNIVFFENCKLFSRKTESESAAYITAASTPREQDYGFVFYQCIITGDATPYSVFLGRPWRNYAKTAFINCHMDKIIHPEGWSNWSRPTAEMTSNYIEFGNSGEGANTAKRIPFSKQLKNPNILDIFKKEVVLSGDDKWNP